MMDDRVMGDGFYGRGEKAQKNRRCCICGFKILLLFLELQVYCLVKIGVDADVTGSCCEVEQVT